MKLYIIAVGALLTSLTACSSLDKLVKDQTGVDVKTAKPATTAKKKVEATEEVTSEVKSTAKPEETPVSDSNSGGGTTSTPTPEPEVDQYPESYSDWWEITERRNRYEVEFANFTDGESFDKNLGHRVNQVEQVRAFISVHCKDPKTKNPRCIEAAKIAEELPQTLVPTFERGLNTKGVDFDFLDKFVFRFEQEGHIDAARADEWLEELGRRKAGYWADRLSALDGKPSAFVAGGRDSLCLFYGAPPKDTTAGLTYAFKAPGKAWMQCAFPTPPAKLKRDDQDYWEVRASYPGSYTDNLNMMFNIAAPSANTLWSVEIPTATISQNIKANMARAGKNYTGNWAFVEVSYVNRYKTGKQWRDNKWVDSWNVTVLGKGRFYYRFR